MDEMARQLGMSKKTIYTYVKDKNTLVEECLNLGHLNEMKEILGVCQANDNAIDEFIKVSTVISARLKTVHPSIFFDLQKYHTKIYHQFNKRTTDFIKKTMIENLEKGKQQGLYRENLDKEIIARMYLAFTNTLFAGEIFPPTEFAYNIIHSEFFRYHIRGIASQKGLTYLKELMNNKNQDIL